MSNVLLLISDEHNPRFASPYGHATVQTPHMQALADQGALFEQAYCPSPLCMPSRSAFMSGLWTHQTQTYSNCNVGLEEARYPTYGGVLAQQGVHTAFIGKTDVYQPASALGFDEMILPQERAWPGDTNHIRRPLSIRRGAARRAKRYGPRDNPYGPDPACVDAAVTWLRERAPALDRPWVLTVNLNAPHFPQWVTPELWALYADAGDLPAHGRDCASANHPYALDLRAHFEADLIAEEDVRGLRRGYLGCITYVDSELGRLVEALRASGAYEDTNVIYTADHGDMMGEFGMWWKCSLYEHSLRVPVIAAGPDFGRRRVATPVSAMDVQASLFACVNRERPAHWHGEPLQQVATDDPRRVVFAEYHGHGTRSGAWMIRQGDWKLIRYAEAPTQLFDLGREPDELVNLAERRPDKVAALNAALEAICDPMAENERAHAFEAEQLRRILAAGLTPAQGE